MVSGACDEAHTGYFSDNEFKYRLERRGRALGVFADVGGRIRIRRDTR